MLHAPPFQPLSFNFCNNTICKHYEALCYVIFSIPIPLHALWQKMKSSQPQI
jgi:hypothetical protein